MVGSHNIEGQFRDNPLEFKHLGALIPAADGGVVGRGRDAGVLIRAAYGGVVKPVVRPRP